MYFKKSFGYYWQIKVFRNADAEDHHPLTTITGSGVCVNISLNNDDDDACRVR